MLDGIKSVFSEGLRGLRWMDEETRAAALNKAEAITDMMAYPGENGYCYCCCSCCCCCCCFCCF